MNTDFLRGLWGRLASSRRYRKQFVSAQAKRAFAFQLRAIMKKRGLTQEKLAEHSGLSQGMISRAADPNYGKLTTTIIVKIANGLDMAYLGILVPFSEAARWFSNLSEDSVQVSTFEEEERAFKENIAALGSVDAEAKRDPTPHSASSLATKWQYGNAERAGMYLQNEAA